MQLHPSSKRRAQGGKKGSQEREEQEREREREKARGKTRSQRHRYSHTYTYCTSSSLQNHILHANGNVSQSAH